jgi:protein phosphatase PTC6
VRIPIKSAKHHFGAGVSRGARPYNEDTYQAGTIEMPAFAKRRPISLTRKRGGDGSPASENQAAKSESGDPQVFYFGVFDGHGGAECSEFLRDRLHGYLEEAAVLFGMESSLRKRDGYEENDADSGSAGGVMGAQDPEDLQKSIVSDWKETVGGYFKRFKPEFFPAVAPSTSGSDVPATANSSSIETVLSYAFLKADLDFTKAQAAKRSELPPSGPPPSSVDDPVLNDRPLNDNDVLSNPDRPASQNLSGNRPTARGSSPNLDKPIGSDKRFKGGSTASIAMFSTPTSTPFWTPASPSTLVVAHVGDTRVLLCRTSDGKSVPLTVNHHPSTPVEATRLRRYAATFVTDSFGEERMLGLANTRSFGDIASKRIGVSAEPQITTGQISPGEYSFMVSMSDGVCGHLTDQEIVDIVKEAKTPAQAAQDLVSFATEVNPDDADNATALVVRLGGWERRGEGGGGSIGTKEQRQYRMNEAADPRSRRQ